MARRKKPESGGATSEWLNTYADMVTLLLTFFILLYSMSSLDAAKFNMLVRAFASDRDSSEKIVIQGEEEGDEQTGSVPPLANDDSATQEITNLDDIYEALQQYIEQNNLSSSVEVSKGDDYVFIRFMDDMLFEANSARLRQSDLELLRFVGNGIKSVQNQAEIIRIDGHTAAIPEDPNYAVSDRLLSSERANSVLMFFEDDLGIDSSKLVQVGYGKTRPIASNDEELERRKNRRVEILISTVDKMGAELDAIYEKLME